MRNVFKNKKIRYIVIIIISIIIMFVAFKNTIIKEVLFLIFISFIISYTLKPINNRIIKLGVNRKLSSTLLIVLLFLIFIMAAAFMIPSIIRESFNINYKVNDIEIYVEHIYEKFKPLRSNKTMYVVLDDVYGRFNNVITKVFSKLMESALNFGANIFDYALIPIIAYYFLSESDRISNVLLNIFPLKSRNLIKNIALDIDKILSRYIASQLFLCFIIGIATFIILIALKVDFPVILSLLNAFFNIIPYFGPIFGAVPIILVSLLKSPQTAIYTTIGMIIIQQIEGNLLSPKITGDSVSMHPLVVIILLIIGEKSGGFLGMILAVPIAVVIKVLYEDLNYYLF